MVAALLGYTTFYMSLNYHSLCETKSDIDGDQGPDNRPQLLKKIPTFPSSSPVIGGDRWMELAAIA